VYGAAACLLFAAPASMPPDALGFQVSFTSVSGSEAPGDLAVGTPFRIVVGFDTAAALAAPKRHGRRFRYNYSTPLRWQITPERSANPCDVNVQNGSIILRDKFSNLVNNVAEPAVDGYSFGAIDDDTSLNLTMRARSRTSSNAPALRWSRTRVWQT